MVPRALIAFGLLAAVVTGGRTIAAAPEQACRAAAPLISREPNIFTADQESDLGDAVAQRYESSLRVIEDERLTAPLREIGTRLASHLPATAFKIRFTLMDVPDANAFVLPGGRVYVSRKLVMFTRTEDELAGVLAHELGHLIARQHAIEMTKLLKEVVGVTDVGDRADIFAKYNRLMDNAARKPNLFNAGREDRDQIEADRIGLFVVAASGYDPRAHVALFDRLAETAGKTGSFLSRMFGTTSPDARRLGELIKSAAALPAGCESRTSQSRAPAYRDWQLAVAGFVGSGRKESLRGVISQTKLPPFRSEITHLRFSPDGRLLLAQDEAGISILTRDPFSLVFRIDSADAEPAQFTPDSSEVMFHTHDLRVERWSVAARKLVDVRDLYKRVGCLATRLSPDGQTIACLDDEFVLSLVDVHTGLPIFQKKRFDFADPSIAFALLTGGSISRRLESIVTLAFSPDGRFFAAGAPSYPVDNSLVYDLTTRLVVNLKTNIRRFVTVGFTFVAPDQLVGYDADAPSKAARIRLPAGEILEEFKLPQGALDAPTSGGFLFVRPFQKYAAGVFDLRTKTVTKGNMTSAIDVHNDVFVAERGTGDLGLHAVEGNELRASVSLPATMLARVRTAAVSSDFKWLAVSERTRGVLWDLEAGQRAALVRNFNGAFIDDNGILFADLPKSGADPRAIMRLDGPARVVGNAGEITERFAAQYGRWMIVVSPVVTGLGIPQGVEFELRDVRRPGAIWRQSYPKNPPNDYWLGADSDALALTWVADSPEGRERIRQDPKLRSSVKLGDIAGDYVMEVIDHATGGVRGRMLIETGKGSFHIRDVLVNGDYVVVTDSLDRVLVYSLANSELRGYAFGDRPVVSTSAGLLAVSNGAGRVVLYDLDTMHKRDELTFSHDVPLKAFSPNGARLFVLTNDQRAHILAIR